MRLHWHRRDLRVDDNRGLVEPDGDVAGVFVFDEDVLAHAGAARVAFMLDAVSSLREAYRDRGSDLLIRRGDPATVLPELTVEYDADAVSWNRDYSGLARERDERVVESLPDGVTPQRFHDAICHEPGSITTTDGDPYSVYTYFWRKWRDRKKDDPVRIGRGAFAPVEGDEPVPTSAELGVAKPDADVPAASTAAARDRLEEFLAEDVFRYEQCRDYPAERCTSRLSPHLKFGTVGIRELDERVRSVRDSAAGERRESVVEFRSQLAWREFYTHVLYFNPEVVTQNYRSYENDIEWEDDPELLDAWKRGETGYPIVDAGMRQLREEAYVHNRVRMIVASFLTKDLLVDWRHGYDHFRTYLVDHDTANDTGGWQWAASTGTDAQPYFRIFNPMTQGKRYDSEAAYIAEYVPELAGVDPEIVHSWNECSPTLRRSAAPGYSDPIVDHSERREAALSMFERARGGTDTET